MRPFIYEFSVLEPIRTNEEFPDKVTDQVYNTFWSILSWKRLLVCYYIDIFAKQGRFEKVGRYTLVLLFFGMKVKACLSRKI
jgi:hypothetical protein